MSQQNISVKHFDVSSRVKPEHRVVVVGKRGSGRMVLMKDVIQQLSLGCNFISALAFISNNSSKEVLSEFMSLDSIHRSFDSRLVEERINSHGDGKHLIVMDDCFFNPNLTGHPIFNRMVEQMGITLVVGVSDVSQLPECLVDQTNFVFALADRDLQNRQQLFQKFFGVFGDFGVFDKTFSNVTRNGCSLVVDRNAVLSSVSSPYSCDSGLNLLMSDELKKQCIGWYKTNSSIPNFCVGHGGYHNPVQVLQEKSGSNTQNTQTLSFQYLDVNRIKTDRTIIIVGKRGTGKSVLMKDLAYQLREHFDGGIACAPNKDMMDLFKEFVPETSIYPDFTPEMVETLIEDQKRLKESGVEKRLFVIADDCMKDKKIFKHPAIAELANNGRHYGISLIICVQHIADMPPNFRMNTDYVFAFADNDPGTREKLFREFFGIFGTKENFKSAFNELTKDRGCIFVDRTLGCASIEDCVCWYKATFNVPQFLLHGHNPLTQEPESLAWSLARHKLKNGPSIDKSNHPSKQICIIKPKTLSSRVEISPLDIQTINSDRIILIVGPKGSGKTVLLRDLVYHLRDKFDGGLAFSSSIQTQAMFKQIMNNDCVYPEFDDGLIAKLVEYQRTLQKYGHRKKLFILFDNLDLLQRRFGSPAMSELAINGRHYDICLIFSTNYLMDVPPNMRTCADYVFASGTNDLVAREKLFKEFFGIFGTKENFKSAFNELTKDRGCIFIDRTPGGASVEDCVCWYKAQLDHPEFKLGMYNPLTFESYSGGPNVFDDSIVSTLRKNLSNHTNQTPSTDTRHTIKNSGNNMKNDCVAVDIKLGKRPKRKEGDEPVPKKIRIWEEDSVLVEITINY
jgi:ABC-type phosphate/phosphonate transport system ATPase subunit